MDAKNISNIVFLLDEREKCITKLSIPNVSYLIQPELNFENALKFIKESPHYGKGTIFVSFCGLFSLTKWCLNSICILNKCFTPYSILKATTVKETLIKRVAKLKINFSKVNINDELIFCEIMPILNEKNLITTNQSKCHHNSGATNLVLSEINFEIDCFNRWIRESKINGKYRNIETFYMNMNSKQLENDKKDLTDTGIRLPLFLQEKRKELVCQIKDYVFNQSHLPIVGPVALKKANEDFLLFKSEKMPPKPLNNKHNLLKVPINSKSKVINSPKSLVTKDKHLTKNSSCTFKEKFAQKNSNLSVRKINAIIKPSKTKKKEIRKLKRNLIKINKLTMFKALNDKSESPNQQKQQTFKTPTSVNTKKCKSKATPCNSMKPFDNAIFIANIAYRQYLERLKSPKVCL